MSVFILENLRMILDKVESGGRKAKSIFSFPLCTHPQTILLQDEVLAFKGEKKAACNLLRVTTNCLQTCETE